MIRTASEMRTQVRENMRGGAGAVTILHCFEKDEFKANSRLCAWLTIPPGAGIGDHAHEREDEVFIILSGTGIVDDGTTQTRVNAGDAVLTGNGQAHSIHNDGNDNLEFIAVIMCY
jgi:mannose-6-phosphate isomerase-like protein (cupin superfamily)